MTHDKAIKILRELGSPIGEYGLMTKSDADDIADRLDRYKDLLKGVLLVTCEWGGRRELLNGIWEAME